MKKKTGRLFDYFMIAVIAIVLTSVSGLCAIEIKSQAKAICLVDVKTKKVLFEKNSRRLVYPASTTKIATAAFALHQLGHSDLQELIQAPQEALAVMPKPHKKKLDYACKPYLLEPDGTTLNIKKQEKLPIQVLLFGLMMASANDSANVLAYHLGHGSIENFMQEMNRWLQSIGCRQTRFVNPHGLHHPQHVTTAYEMTVIAMEAIKNPKFHELVTTPKVIRPRTNKQEASSFSQPNRLMNEGDYYYPYARGIKTGYTEDAGYCLVAMADNGQRALIAAVMGSPTSGLRYADVIELFNQAFEERLEQQVLFQHSEARFTHPTLKAEKKVEAGLNQDILYSYYPSLKPVITTAAEFSEVQLPLKKGTIVGQLAIIVDGERVAEYPMHAIDDYAVGVHLKLWQWLCSHRIALALGFLLLNAGFYWLFQVMKKAFCHLYG